MMIGKLRDLTMNRDGTQNVTITVNSDFREEFDALKDKAVWVDIKKYSKQRSLSANAYAWVLIDKIAEKMHMEKSFVYRMVIRDLPGVSEIVCTQTENAARLKRRWEAHGLGWQAEEFPSKVEGCTNFVLYCGSSEYDTSQMAAMIRLLIQEAEGLGIPTITPREEAELLERWGRKKEPTAV